MEISKVEILHVDDVLAVSVNGNLIPCVIGYQINSSTSGKAELTLKFLVSSGVIDLRANPELQMPQHSTATNNVPSFH